MSKLRCVAGRGFFLLLCARVSSWASGQTLTTLATFNGANGDLPYSGLVADSAGNMYGTTFYGGDYGYGSIFKLDAATHAMSSVGSFNATNGSNPVNYGQLVIDGQGNLFGTTATGGANHSGTVFQWSAATHAISTLVSFDRATTGYLPYGALSVDSSGNLYGTTQFGGPKNGGSVFKIDADTHAFNTLKTFQFVDSGEGWSPLSAPIIDSHGNLYGTTAVTIYRIDAQTHAFATVARFPVADNGDAPKGEAPTGLAIGPDGNLYGTTRDGGDTNNGVVFEFDTTSQSLTALASFNGGNGSLPHGAAIFGPDGKLYGTTYGGGDSGPGTVFAFDLATQAITTLASFDGNNGANPTSTPFLDGNGHLFGTATGDNSQKSDLGSVFELSVPEPSSLLTVILGAAYLGMRRRRTIQY